MGQDDGLIRLFETLGERNRLALWRLLGLHELSVGELALILGVPQNRVSRHLKALKEAGLVRDRRVGTAVYHQQTEIPGEGMVGRLTGELSAWARSEALPAVLVERLAEVLRARASGGKAFSDGLADRWDGLRRQYFGDSFAFEAMMGLLPSGWKVADVGCGTGYLLVNLARQFGEVIAVDASEGMLERARQRVDAAGLSNVTFRTGRLESLPLESGEVDAAIASLVLHHTLEPQSAVRELVRVVRPGGRVLVVEIDRHDDGPFMAEMGDQWPGLDRQELAAWLSQSGLVDVRTQTCGSVSGRSGGGSPAPPLYSVVGVRSG